MPHLDAPIIRLATGADARLLAELGATTFHETFAADNRPEDMAAYIKTTFTPERLASELADPLATFLIATLDGPTHSVPVGYAKLYAGEPLAGVTPTTPAPLELARLYVAATCIGRGVGAALMRACIAQAADRGVPALWLGVWEHNRRAKAFYEQWGFATVGSHIFQLGGDAQTDLVMQKFLGDAAERGPA